MPNVSLYIKCDDNSVYMPIVCDGIELESERVGSPAKLTFTVVKDQIIRFPEGVPVALYVDGKGIFQGYVFQKSRDKEHHIQCVAYDQLRYFKNKSTYVYENKTASELVKMLADDFKLQLGTIEDTGHKIKSCVEQDVTLFDIVLNALKVTENNSKKRFVLYDDFGKIMLKNIESMKINLLVDDSTAENFDYTSSIDDDTYNQVLLLVEDDGTTSGKKTLKPYFKRDEKNIAGWGILQHSETLTNSVNVNFEALAENILKLKNRKTRHLEVKGVFGDINVRAGCSLPIHLNIGDIVVNSYLVCDRVVHYFRENDHTMDLTLWDGDTFTG